jgi:DNA-binding transcriptional MocR family regulator
MSSRPAPGAESQPGTREDFRPGCARRTTGLDRPLRKQIAQYLGLSRGLKCDADEVVIVSAVRQALDLLFRVLVKKDDPVWMEDPGYFGAFIALRNAGAKIIPVPVDEQGLSVSAGMKLCPKANGVFLTPGHQDNVAETADRSVARCIHGRRIRHRG